MLDDDETAGTQQPVCGAFDAADGVDGLGGNAGCGAARPDVLGEHARAQLLGSRQVAEVTVPRSELEKMWRPEYLERLARTYWSFLSRFSLGLIRVLYGEMAEIVTKGQRVVPKAALELGYAFAHPDLDEALRSALSPS